MEQSINVTSSLKFSSKKYNEYEAVKIREIEDLYSIWRTFWPKFQNSTVAKLIHFIVFRIDIHEETRLSRFGKYS